MRRRLHAKRADPAPPRQSGRHFNLMPVASGDSGGPPADVRYPEPPEPGPEAEPGPVSWAMAIRFPTPRAALGHVAAVLDLGAPTIRLSPHDGSVWTLLEQTQLPGVTLAPAYGGRAYQEIADGSLLPYPPRHPGTTEVSRPSGHGSEHRSMPERLADINGWEPVTLARLAGHAPTGPVPRGLREVVVFASGPLARWMLRRCLSAGVSTTFAPVERLEWPQDTARQPDPSWLVLLLGAEQGTLPAGLLETFARLPGTLICRPASPDARVLVDLRLRVPFDERRLTDELPEGRYVVVQPAEIGPPWLWQAYGEPADAALLAESRITLVPAPPRTAPPVPELGPPMPVRVVVSPRAGRRTDAVLVDDAELDGLRRFLQARPLHETGAVAFGPGRHLVTEPPGLVQSLPFGVPVYQAGPGALYLESGCVLSPPLPRAAREQVLGLRPDRITVVCRDGAWELRLEHVRPAWSLWAPEPPAYASGVSERARKLLDRMASVVPDPEPGPMEQAPEAERRRLNQQAMEHSFRGEYREAAALLEQAGHFQRAAQMYERAAAALAEGW
ncbi:hypothetical protein ACWGCW_21035 [Streptomyces sp. NPDC054933]